MNKKIMKFSISALALVMFGQYEKGLMSGVWQYYYPSGSIQSIQKYDEGKVVSLDYWDATIFAFSTLYYGERGAQGVVVVNVS